jgi:hypothetical protein
MSAAIIPPEKGEQYRAALLKEMRYKPDLERAARWLQAWQEHAITWWRHKPADAREAWVSVAGGTVSVTHVRPPDPPTISLSQFTKQAGGPQLRSRPSDFDRWTVRD